MQSEEQKKNVPADKQIADRWNAGMKALEDLRMRAEADPEDSQEIHAHLATIKAAYGFTALTAEREGNAWSVDAAMNPKKKVKINAGTKAEPDNQHGKDGAEGKQGKDAKQGKDGGQPNRRLPKDGEWAGARGIRRSNRTTRGALASRPATSFSITMVFRIFPRGSMAPNSRCPA